MWFDNDYRRVFMDMHLNDTNEEYLSKLDVKDFVELLKWKKGEKTYVSIINQQTVVPVYPLSDIEFTINGEFRNTRLVSDNNYNFISQCSNGKTTIKVDKTDIFHVFELY